MKRGAARPSRSARAALATLGIVSGIAIGTAPAMAAPHAPIASAAELDRQTAFVLDTLADGDLRRATVLARQLARRFPRFALGQLLHAELASLAALDGTLVASEAPWPPALIDLLLEARARLETADAAPPQGVARAAIHAATRLPAPFVQLGRHVQAVVLVDLARSTLSLHTVRDGIALELREHYVSSGSAGYGKWREGDRKTPLGLYRITGFRSDASLPELYGAGALMLDYPNAHDRLLGRSGSGIWLHGVPHARLSRAPRSSEGCVTMSNEHLLALHRATDPNGTLVVLAAALARETDTSPVEAMARRTRYRELFREYRDARVGGGEPDTVRFGGHTAGELSAVELEALGATAADTVTILQSTADGLPGVADLLVMDIRLGAGGETRITLWWSRSGEDDWTLTLEDIAASGA